MAKIHGNGGDIGGHLEHGARDIAEKMESGLETMKDKVGELGTRVGGFVKEHPIMSLAAGVGVGLLFARLLTRR